MKFIFKLIKMAPSKSPKADAAKKTVKTVKTKKGGDEKKKARRR